MRTAIAGVPSRLRGAPPPHPDGGDGSLQHEGHPACPGGSLGGQALGPQPRAVRRVTAGPPPIDGRAGDGAAAPDPALGPALSYQVEDWPRAWERSPWRCSRQRPCCLEGRLALGPEPLDGLGRQARAALRKIRRPSARSGKALSRAVSRAMAGGTASGPQRPRPGRDRTRRGQQRAGPPGGSDAGRAAPCPRCGCSRSALGGWACGPQPREGGAVRSAMGAGPHTGGEGAPNPSLVPRVLPPACAAGPALGGQGGWRAPRQWTAPAPCRRARGPGAPASVGGLPWQKAGPSGRGP